jgi:hypothetical protein
MKAQWSRGAHRLSETFRRLQTSAQARVREQAAFGIKQNFDRIMDGKIIFSGGAGRAERIL